MLTICSLLGQQEELDYYSTDSIDGHGSTPITGLHYSHPLSFDATRHLTEDTDTELGLIVREPKAFAN